MITARYLAPTVKASEPARIHRINIMIGFGIWGISIPPQGVFRVSSNIRFSATKTGHVRADDLKVNPGHLINYSSY